MPVVLTPKPDITKVLVKLQTSEDEEQIAEVQRLAKADAYAPGFVLGGALLNPDLAGDPTTTRLAEALDALAGRGVFDMEDDEREAWAYRLGLVTGLRLGRAIGETA